MSVLIFPVPVGAAEHGGPAVGAVGMLVVLAGGCGVQFLLLWGPTPAAVSTVPAASGPGVTAGNVGSPCAAWQPPASALEPL